MKSNSRDKQSKPNTEFWDLGTSCSSAWTAKVQSLHLQYSKLSGGLSEGAFKKSRSISPGMLNNTYWWSSEPSVLCMLDAPKIIISDLLGCKLEDIFPRDAFFSDQAWFEDSEKWIRFSNIQLSIAEKFIILHVTDLMCLKGITFTTQ